MAMVYFVAGLALVALSIGAIAGPWWGALVAGVELVALGVLEQRGRHMLDKGEHR